MPIKNFKCVVSYKGTNYYGWQKQLDQATIQGVIEYSLGKFFGCDVRTGGASRTDAGVHAFGQVFQFKIETGIDARGIKSILNDILPPDIRIVSAQETDPDFNPRRNVRKKLYRYLIYNRKLMQPVYMDAAWHVTEKIDVKKMSELLPLFKGKKNYFCFSSSGTPARSWEREVKSIKIQRNGPWIIFDFKGESFLHHMIRRMTAAFVFYSQGKLTYQQVEELFEKQDRGLLPGAAPARGLYLVKIIYGKKITERADE
ncbi:MAG: tRNA pseudouridine(38-40) synthase TruA [Spirochaetia bacterium]|nr:tRNA pseudouridine(38-40) synthase TruA [Spirochaetia bacterium]